MMINPNPSPFSSPFPTTPSPHVQNSQSRKTAIKNPSPRENSLPRYINYLADLSGCGHWRILWPEQVINATGRGVSHSLTAMVADPRFYNNVKAVKVQRQASSSQKKFVSHLKQVQQEAGFKLIYEVDDVVFKEEIPDYNKFKFAFDKEEVRQNCIDIINMCDEVTVTCPFMKQLYHEKTGHNNITVIPNFVPDFWMGHLFNGKEVATQFEKNKRKPRILYTGSGAHYDVDNKTGGKDDFTLVRDFVRRTVDKYQWIFVGSYPPQLVDLVRQKKIEFYPWQNLLNYPRFISSLRAQLMVAPLEENNFNRAKSDIKFIEACTLGIPCLCQDMVTYSTAPESLRFSTIEEFSDKIDTILSWKNRSKYYGNIHKLRGIGEDRILESSHNIGSHLEVLNTPYGSADRKLLDKWN
jgi:O-antigen biosynthesis protein